MNELNWLVVDKIQASKFEPEYKNVVSAFNSLVLAEDFINLVIPEATRQRFDIEHR